MAYDLLYETLYGFSLRCESGNDAVTICTAKNCYQNPLACEDQDCNCFKTHKLCQSISIKKFEYLLTQKGKQKVLPVLISEAKWCQNGIKRLAYKLKQIKEKIKNYEIQLEGDEGKLYQALKNGESQSIDKVLINSVLDSLKNKQKPDLKEFQIQLAIQLDNIQSVIDRATETFEPFENNIPMKFSYTLHHSTINVLNDNQIKMERKFFRLAVMEPSLQGRKKGVQKFKFSLTHTAYHEDFLFGIGHKNIAKRENFEWISGFYGIYSKGHMWAHHDPSQTKDSSGITAFKKNDVVQVAYDDENNELVVTNLSNGQSQLIHVKKIPNNPLHLMVPICDFEDTVVFHGQVNE